MGVVFLDTYLGGDFVSTQIDHFIGNVANGYLETVVGERVSGRICNLAVMGCVLDVMGVYFLAKTTRTTFSHNLILALCWELNALRHAWLVTGQILFSSVM